MRLLFRAAGFEVSLGASGRAYRLKNRGTTESNSGTSTGIGSGSGCGSVGSRGSGTQSGTAPLSSR